MAEAEEETDSAETTYDSAAALLCQMMAAASLFLINGEPLTVALPAAKLVSDE